MKISAFCIAEQLDIKKLRAQYAGTLLQETPSELFYRVDGDGYCYIFDYGAVVFANIQDANISQNLAYLHGFCLNPLPEMIRDDFEIIEKPGAPINFGFDDLIVPTIDEYVMRITMINLSHSISLDFYSQRADDLLSEVHQFTDQLKNKGSIDISRKEMLKFIGRTLNSQNRIVENLFIFDSPEMTWDDEYLGRIHRGLARTFEVQSRFKETEYTFKVVENNLEVFRDLYFHRESNKLEWIIIILICIEVADLIFTKVFAH